MKQQSYTAENYLKTIYHLSIKSETVQTNAIAEQLNTKAASVTDMLKKLANNGLVNYVKYQGVSLSNQGRAKAINIIRKHRLWEVFLVKKLNFKWDEVHEIAEELEHINSDLLIEKLDEYLDYPTVDPHGDPIPDSRGEFSSINWLKLHQMNIGDKGIISGVSEHSSAFLQHLEKQGLTIGKNIQVLDYNEYDSSMEIKIQQKTTVLSKEVANHLLIEKLI